MLLERSEDNIISVHWSKTRAMAASPLNGWRLTIMAIFPHISLLTEKETLRATPSTAVRPASMDMPLCLIIHVTESRRPLRRSLNVQLASDLLQ